MDALVCGYEFDASGVPALADLHSDKSAAGFLWLHMDATHPETHAWLKNNPRVPIEIADALIAEETRPRCEEVEQGLLLNLRGVNLNPGADPEDMVSLRAWLADGLLVTTRRRPLMAIKDIQTKLEKGWSPEWPDQILIELATRLTARMDGVVQELEEGIDSIEEASVEGGVESQRSKVIDVRRATIMLRRFISPQREALTRLQGLQTDLISDASKRKAREIADSLTRLVEDLDAVRDRGAVLNDQIADQRAEAMNRNMLVLSVVAAMFLPLGFLTGLLGINVGGIPGAENPLAFWFVVLGLGGIGAGILAFFRHIKWL